MIESVNNFDGMNKQYIKKSFKVLDALLVEQV